MGLCYLCLSKDLKEEDDSKIFGFLGDGDWRRRLKEVDFEAFVLSPPTSATTTTRIPFLIRSTFPPRAAAI